MKRIVRKMPVDQKFLEKNRRYGSWAYFSLLGLLSVALAVLIGIRYFGLPAPIQQKVLTELQSRGLTVHFSKLYLDPLGRVVARNVEIFQTRDAKTTSITVNRVAFGFNWISWWRKEPFLNTALVQDAHIAIPLTQDTSVELDNVSADIDLQQDMLLVKSAEAKIGQLVVQGHGVIRLNGQAPSTPPTEEAMQARAKVWKSIRKAISEIPRPLNVALDFDTTTQNPLDGKATLDIQSKNQLLRGILIRSIALQVSYSEHTLRIARAQIDLDRGSLILDGNADLNAKKGLLNIRSDMDLSLLSPLLPSNAADVVSLVRFDTLPQCSASLEADWNEEPKFFGRFNLDWQKFWIDNQQLTGLRCSASTDGKRIFVSDFLLSHPSGNITVELFRDQDKKIRGRFTSGINPTVLKGLFGKGAKNFFDNISFAESPQIECKIEGDETQLSNMKFEGSLLAKDFTYRNGRGTSTTLALLQSKFTFAQKVLTLPDLKVTRVKGEDGSAAVVYDFNTRLVEIKNAKTHLNVQKFCPVFGGKLEIYTEPYHFFEPPNLTIDGVVDLATEKKTNLKVHIESERGMDYVFLGKPLLVTKIKSDLTLVNQQLSVKFSPPTALFNGGFTGWVDLDLTKETSPYKTQLKFEKLAFDQLLRTYFNKEDVTGTMSAEVRLRGLLNDIKSIDGEGSLTVIDGDVYKIPVFGALSMVMSAIVPDAGYSRADRAKADFSFSQGVISMTGVEIYSALFAVIGGGRYDYVKDDLDMSMRVNVRGIIGIPMFVFSKLFEYQGTGKLSSAKWEPKIF